MKVFWGIGKMGKLLLDAEKVDAIVDSNREKVGQTYGGGNGI